MKYFNLALYLLAFGLLAWVDWRIALGVWAFGWAHNIEKHN